MQRLPQYAPIGFEKSKPFDAFSKFKSTEDKGGFINNGT